MKYRYESFGGIVASEEPPFLAFVDRAYMRELGLARSPLWQGPDHIGVLSAPLEVHFAVTNRCSRKCLHCYMGSGPTEAGELDTDQFKSALDLLAELNVFHVALGGGEALEREDLFAIAAYARQRGLVPNLTSNGCLITGPRAEQMRIFGQVNLSLDGTAEHSAVFRGTSNFDVVDRAATHLIAAGVSTGINCVLGRRNFEQMEPLFAYAQDRGLSEIEILRYKPAGRAAGHYEAERMTDSQSRNLVPTLAELGGRYGITAKIDCSLVPMLCWGKPPIELLEKSATYGCEAGNVLLGIRANGAVAGCSFLGASGLSVFDLRDGNARRNAFLPYVEWTETAPEPCQSCEYLTICKGGCRAVSAHVTGDPMAPDPECPFVVDFYAGSD